LKISVIYTVLQKPLYSKPCKLKQFMAQTYLKRPKFAQNSFKTSVESSIQINIFEFPENLLSNKHSSPVLRKKSNKTVISEFQIDCCALNYAQSTSKLQQIHLDLLKCLKLRF
jgi:hypothetical protein